MVCLILAFALQGYIHAPFIRPIVAHFIGLPLRPSPHPAVRSLNLCIIMFCHSGNVWTSAWAPYTVRTDQITQPRSMHRHTREQPPQIGCIDGDKLRPLMHSINIEIWARFFIYIILCIIITIVVVVVVFIIIIIIIEQTLLLSFHHYHHYKHLHHDHYHLMIIISTNHHHHCNHLCCRHHRHHLFYN